MKLALLKGNRFNPWHLQGYRLLRGGPEVTAFRAESEIQRRFRERDDVDLGFNVERIYYDTEAGPLLPRLGRRLKERFFDRQPQLVPFHHRLADFDMIQSWELFTDWSAEALLAREKYGIPLAVMVWDNIPFNMERDPARRELKRQVAREADLFLVHTERSRRMLDLEDVPREKVMMLPPGVDTKMFSPGAGRRDDFGLDDDEFVILFVGWLLPRKGIDFLILALRELLQDPALADYRVRLLVVGSGPGKDRVSRLISRVGVGDACTFAGALPYSRMTDAFRAADVFALPSIAMPEWQEQFGMSLIEAMACGVPVISTLSGAIPEIAGECAVLCQPNDFFSLYESIRHLILNPGDRAALGAAGRRRAVSEFDLRKHAECLSDAYERLLGQ